MEADEAELACTVEEDAAPFAGAAFCDGVPEAVVPDPLFVIRYMARPIITTMAMTIAAPTAAATPARDFSNLISTDHIAIIFI
jgi:hypothetical protein